MSLPWQITYLDSYLMSNIKISLFKIKELYAQENSNFSI